MRVVAIINAKGGTSKTTTSVNLGHGFARRGRRVLVVDCDSQHSATAWIGTDEPPEGTFADVLTNPKTVRNAIAASTIAGVDLLHGSRATSLAERDLQASPAPTTALKRALRFLDGYDLVLLDAPPGIGVAALNAIAAATELLVPVETQTMALAGLGLLRETLEELVEAEVLAAQPPMRVLATMHDGRTALAREVLAHLRNGSGVEVCDTVVRLNTKLAEAFGYRSSIFTVAPTSSGALDYQALAEELDHAP